jgi:hypothetical protein
MERQQTYSQCWLRDFTGTTSPRRHIDMCEGNTETDLRERGYEHMKIIKSTVRHVTNNCK